MFLIHRILVFLSSCLGVSEYSHDLIQKKIPTVQSCEIAISREDFAASFIFLMTESGMAF